MQWYESEDDAAMALESAAEYLWGIDWDGEKIWKQIDVRLDELEEGIALNPLNPYYIPEEEQQTVDQEIDRTCRIDDEPDCGCRVPGDICSEGEYIGRCECEAFEMCDVCVGEYAVDHDDDESVPVDGFPDYVMTELGRLEEKIDKLTEMIRPRQYVTPQFGMGGGCAISTPGPHQQAWNVTPGVCNCLTCVQRRKQSGSQT